MLKLGVNPFASVTQIAEQLRSPILNCVPKETEKEAYNSGESRAAARFVRSSGNGAGKETV